MPSTTCTHLANLLVMQEETPAHASTGTRARISSESCPTAPYSLWIRGCHLWKQAQGKRRKEVKMERFGFTIRSSSLAILKPQL